jgi:chorismate mutase
MVAQIERWRDEIDAIDAELLSLLNRRVLLAREVGRRKRGVGLPLRDARRERQILARARERNRGPLGAAAVARLFRAILAESRRATRHTLAHEPAAGSARRSACA